MECKLDRVLCNSKWLDFWEQSDCYTLPRHFSDHNPLVLQFIDNAHRGPRPFRFMKMWTEHEDFKNFVEEKWKSYNPLGCNMFILTAKLRSLKKDLKIWNRNVFGNIHERVDKAKKELENIQLLLSNSGFSEDLFQLETNAHNELFSALQSQTTFYKERSRAKWLQEGDRNSNFFHNSVKSNAKNRGISMLLINGEACTDKNFIKDHVINFYTELFNG